MLHNAHFVRCDRIFESTIIYQTIIENDSRSILLSNHGAKSRKHVHPNHVTGESVGSGVDFSALRTDAFQLGRTAGVFDVPTQRRLTPIPLAALQALMLAVSDGRVHVCNKTQKEVTSVLARIGRAAWMHLRNWI